MFSGVCTVFNYCEYEDGSVIWHPHILSSVHIETDIGSITSKTGPESADKIEVFIGYTETDGNKFIQDMNGLSLKYLRPKEWKTQEDHSETITFNPENDFFWVGEWTGDNPVNDADYADRHSEGFYAYMNRTEDDVYKVTKVQMYNVIPHFEVMGA